MDIVKRKPVHRSSESSFVNLAELQPGDLIEIFRFGYQHWAIYVGNGYVIHLAPPSEFAGAGCASLMSTLTDKALVKKELLEGVVGKNRFRVNNKHDSKHPPLPIPKIVRRAEEMVGQELEYKVTSENCPRCPGWGWCGRAGLGCSRNHRHRDEEEKTTEPITETLRLPCSGFFLCSF